MKDEVIYDAYQTTFRSINEMNLFIEEFYRTGSWERTPVDQLEFFPVPSDIGELSIMAMASGLSSQIMQ
ncbi:MAG: hypothetical protein LBV27_08870, partial [Oscillospiraceae bacterium]|nr:hypothetical protein [Oscillospiraceae bacterium]